MTDHPESQADSSQSANQQTRWHRILGKLFELLLVSLGISVQTEPEVMSNPPKADLLLLRRFGKVWTAEQRSRLPDGIRDSVASHILIEFKYTESLNAKAIRQALGYDHFYVLAKELSDDDVATFLLSAKSPSRATLADLGFQPTEQAGIYRSEQAVLCRVTLVLLNELANEPHNAYVKCFASRQRAQAAAFALLQQVGLRSISEQLEWLVDGLRALLMTGATTMQKELPFELTPEFVMKFGEQWEESYLRNLPVDVLLRYHSAEEILKHLKLEERLAGLKPEEVLAQFELEEKL
ncbi:MAG: hypothetical protein KDE19_21355, partial [Caldilineaceae bacterium]|nr:hypothetical protein [Caldilineaceae bacterium]